MGTRFLVVGHEARDHALAWKLAQSPAVETVYIGDGNRAVPFDAKLSRLIDYSHEELADFVEANGIACTIVGDTSDMQDGIVDLFAARGLPILGAHKAAAQLEGSKAFAKDFMRRHGIPTAQYRMCNDPDDILGLLAGCRYPLVLKSDLRVASQNSAVIIRDEAQAIRTCQEIFEAQGDKFDDEPAQVLMEEFITGREVSYTILLDGEHWTPLISVRDYKRLLDNDGGCNTGGMGSYAPASWLTPDMHAAIAEKIVEPTLRGMRAEGLQYRGFLYIGIMVDAQGQPWVLEYNTRLGDTEAETILSMWEDDFAEVSMRAAAGSIAGLALTWREGYAVSIAIAPKGYPDAPLKTPISLPFPKHENAKCFGSIIRSTDDGKITTGPGRVACVTAHAKTIAECRDIAYATARRLDSGSRLHYRKDIGLELLPVEDAVSGRQAA